MKPSLGWTMLSRADMRQAERALESGDRGTRDEIGFLLIHQAFADRFFPGTSVLHTRLRYALFIPWLYQRAADSPRRGRDLEARIRDLLIELVRRLKLIGKEPRGVIGGDKPDELTAQPSDVSYWGALRTWGIVLEDVTSRTEARRRLQAQRSPGQRDENGDRIDDGSIEVFRSLVAPPDDWDKSDGALNFPMRPREREFLRGRLTQLLRSDGKPTLLARLMEARRCIHNDAFALPKALDAVADEDDKRALAVARDAASLTAIGRAVYGALVEHLLAADGINIEPTFRNLLEEHLVDFGAEAGRCDIVELQAFMPTMPKYVREVLQQTKDFARLGDPSQFAGLLTCYRESECRRKGQRARLANTHRAALRRRDWDPLQHNTERLHYRWGVVYDMLNDLFGES